MFKTPFEENLDEFLYGETCDAEQGYDRKAQGVKLNVVGVVDGRLSTIASCTAVAKEARLTGSYLRSPYDWPNDLRVRTAFSSKAQLLDDKARDDLVEEIKTTREDFKLSQDDLAKLIDVDKSTLSKLERLEHSPQPATLTKYLAFLELAKYLREKNRNRKYTIRQLFKDDSKLFGGLNPIEFSHSMGEDGLAEVYGIFKRLYG